MYISQETPEQTKDRLLKVIKAAEISFLEGTFAFEEFAAGDLTRRIRADALALVRDGEAWSQLVRSEDASTELFSVFSFHFSENLDNSGFVGWLATYLKEKLGTGVFVICGQNSNRGGIFDYWGCPFELSGEAKLLIEDLMIRDKAS